MKKKIGIFTWFDDECNYSNYFVNKNLAYSSKYRYDFISSSKRRLPVTKKPHFERIPLLLENFDKYDHLVWLDADAYMLDRDLSELTDNIKSDIIIGFDQSKKVKAYDRNFPNDINIQTGAFIVKSSDYSKRVLEEWLSQGMPAAKKYKNYGNSLEPKRRYRFRDQGALRWMYFNNMLDIRGHSTILPHGTLQTFNPQNNCNSYIMHYAGRHAYKWKLLDGIDPITNKKL